MVGRPCPPGRELTLGVMAEWPQPDQPTKTWRWELPAGDSRGEGAGHPPGRTQTRVGGEIAPTWAALLQQHCLYRDSQSRISGRPQIPGLNQRLFWEGKSQE